MVASSAGSKEKERGHWVLTTGVNSDPKDPSTHSESYIFKIIGFKKNFYNAQVKKKNPHIFEIALILLMHSNNFLQ